MKPQVVQELFHLFGTLAIEVLVIELFKPYIQKSIWFLGMCI
jgi:hypothetical protein